MFSSSVMYFFCNTSDGKMRFSAQKRSSGRVDLKILRRKSLQISEVNKKIPAYQVLIVFSSLIVKAFSGRNYANSILEELGCLK